MSSLEIKLPHMQYYGVLRRGMRSVFPSFKSCPLTLRICMEQRSLAVARLLHLMVTAMSGSIPVASTKAAVPSFPKQ